jgi:hypothetical protein
MSDDKSKSGKAIVTASMSMKPYELRDWSKKWGVSEDKAQALLAYDQYIKDAKAAKSLECATFFRKVHDADKAQLAEAKHHLVAVLQGKMGSPAAK